VISFGKHCTGVPDRLLDYDMSGCCEMHDVDYVEQRKSRLEADTDFFWCVSRVAPEALAHIGFIGVRALGWVPWYGRRLWRRLGIV
jgi:hypothetical protein